MPSKAKFKPEPQPRKADCLSPFCRQLRLNKETAKVVCGVTGETSDVPDMRRSDCVAGRAG